MNDIRRRIGNSAFTSLFDMGDSSALAILLDVTGSMDTEIEAVKKEIIDIVTVSKMNKYSKQFLDTPRDRQYQQQNVFL